VAGTPSDAVLLGVLEIMKDHKPDLILSGVNRGQNIAEDTSQSGTVAAAIEGMHLGIPSVALSQAFTPDQHVQVRWSAAEAFGPDVIRKLLAAGWPKEGLVNINFPDRTPDKVEGVRVTSQGKRDQATLAVDERIDARGNPYFWIGFKRILSNPPAGTDLRAIYDGYVSVTPLHLNLTEQATLAPFEAVLGTPPKKPRKGKPQPKAIIG